MSASAPFIELERFSTFGDLLKYLRRREGLTQRELSIAVGYSIAQISRLEQNLRLPDLATIAARFVPALDLEEEADIARRLMELAAAVRSEDAPASGAPPYKGLNYFDEADADLYFGREALVEKLLSRLLGEETGAPWPFLAVVGASGSGKSSVVRAGLVHALRWKSPSANWPVYLLTPTAHPLEALAVSLTHESESTMATATLMDDLGRDPRALHLYARRLWSGEAGAFASPHRRGEKSPSHFGPASPTRLVLVVDQFEELFTLCRDDIERAAFVDNLLTAAFESNGPTCLVITLRADFYAYCAPYAALRAALAGHQEYIGPMSADELRRAIEEPARRGGWELEEGLADVILRDVGADGSRSPEPGALPLLSHALLETWHRRRGRALTLSGYLASGGVRGAITETAETVFRDQLDARQQAIARNIFLRLTALGDDEEVIWTRRRVTFDELIPTGEEAAMVREVLTCLADARLVTTSETAAEVAHEALLREWPRLSEWLANNRAGIRLQRQLTNAAAEWRKANRDPGFLLTGARLAQFENLAMFSTVVLTQEERAYLEASLAERDRREAEERERQQHELAAAQKLAETERARAKSERQRAEDQARYVSRVRTRNRAIAVAGAIALVLAVLAGVFGLQSNQNAARAEAEKRLATSRELAASALINLTVDPERSLLLALQAVDTTYSVDKTVLLEVEEALHAAVQASHLQLSLPASSASGIGVVSVVFSPDGKRLATIDEYGTAKVWEVSPDAPAGQSRELLTLPGHNTSTGYQAIAFSPDGMQLATAGEYNVVRVWDAVSGKELLAVPSPLFVTAIAFSPDGQRIAVGGDEGGEVWDAATSKTLISLITLPRLTAMNGIAFSPDRARIATAGSDNLTRVWDAATGELLLTISGHAQPVNGVTFSPLDGGARLATVSDDGTARVWDPATGQQVLLINTESRFGVAFSPDGKRLATGGKDGSAQVWDAATGKELFTLLGHTGTLFSVAFNQDGTRLATASADGTAKVWDTHPDGESVTLSGHTKPVFSVAYSPDGTRLVTGGLDKRVRVWDAATGEELFQLAGKLDVIQDVAISPDGKRIATVTDGNGVPKVWDAATGQLLLTLYGIHLPAWSIAFSPDGARLATGSWEVEYYGPPTVWDAATGKELFALVGHIRGVASVAFSPDGTRIATGSDDTTAKVWDAATGKELLTLSGHTGAIQSVAFSPLDGGKRLATASADGTAKVWDISASLNADAATGKELFTLAGHIRGVASVVFSPDGTRIATGSDDKTARVWDAATGKLLQTLPGPKDGITSVAFSPDGIHLAVASRDGTTRVYVLRIEDLLVLARSRVARSLTDAECQQYLHMEVCPRN